MVSSSRNNHLWFVGICAPEITMLFRLRFPWRSANSGESGEPGKENWYRVVVLHLYTGTHDRGYVNARLAGNVLNVTLVEIQLVRRYSRRVNNFG